MPERCVIVYQMGGNGPRARMLGVFASEDVWLETLRLTYPSVKLIDGYDHKTGMKTIQCGPSDSDDGYAWDACSFTKEAEKLC